MKNAECAAVAEVLEKAFDPSGINCVTAILGAFVLIVGYLQ